MQLVIRDARLEGRDGRYDIGIATDTPQGLLVPVVKGADAMTIPEISAEIRRLAAAALISIGALVAVIGLPSSEPRQIPVKVTTAPTSVRPRVNAAGPTVIKNFTFFLSYLLIVYFIPQGVVGLLEKLRRAGKERGNA